MLKAKFNEETVNVDTTELEVVMNEIADNAAKLDETLDLSDIEMRVACHEADAAKFLSHPNTGRATAVPKPKQVKETRPAVFSAAKQQQHLLSDFAINRVRDGQSIGVIALRLFESALTWELTKQHPDKKTYVIASVMAVTNWNKSVDSALTAFFAAIKSYSLGLPDGYELPWVTRFREYNPSAIMRAPNVDAVSGAATGLMLAIRFDRGVTNRSNKLADNFQEINNQFIKAGYDGAPSLVLALITHLYKVAN